MQLCIEDQTDLDRIRCVMVGRLGNRPQFKYLILVVQSTDIREYERVGVGLVHSNHLSKLADDIRIT